MVELTIEGFGRTYVLQLFYGLDMWIATGVEVQCKTRLWCESTSQPQSRQEKLKTVGGAS
jgi:hypothetical protein